MIWYVTVGVPGGEFAVQAEGLGLAYTAIDNGAKGTGIYLTNTCLGFHGAEIQVRPAPPELEEWLNHGMGVIYQFLKEGDQRQKVIGGWLTAHAFIPVALSSGITVIEAGE